MTKNTKSILAIAVSTAVLMLFFQNCRSQVQIDDITKSDTLSVSEDDNSAANTEQPNTPSPAPSPAPRPAPAPTMPEPAPAPSPAPQPAPAPAPAPQPAPQPTPTPAPAPAPQPAPTPIPVNPFNPNDPNIGLLPTEGEWASVAYEDNINDTNAGDRDYNDAVFNYKISEQYNSSSQLVRIFIEVKLREKISSSTHRLYLALNGNPSASLSNIDHISLPAFEGQATVKINYHNGDEVTVQDAKNKLINVFRNTTNTKDQVTKVQIDLARPDLNVNSSATKVVNFKKYRLILQNHGSDKGIDIAEINPSDEMLSNGNGYPFGFMIPTNWAPPIEHQLVDDKYPNFHLYREWLNGSQQGAMPDAVKNWYK